MKFRVLFALAAMAMAGASAPPDLLDLLNGAGEAPLVNATTWIQHVNLLTS
ncbi:hypothetical protein ITP53_50310 [Nonomuraea sp. K274]|uniref:Uncharacterized protein n=1 Tax=Nonomuraea cypriaca TaxID=1187855 RepID=A0A931ARP8_9ACTN|nr:hypothetical protein [Nonomuraea cypriaca]MBF8193742.1 hypothetical protein [Nonomuraea cypriaca]